MCQPPLESASPSAAPALLTQAKQDLSGIYQTRSHKVKQYQRASRMWASHIKADLLLQQRHRRHTTQAAGKVLSQMDLRSFTLAKRAILFSIWKR